MKKVIVLSIMVTFCAINCKKKEKDPEPTAPVDTQTYCVYEVYKGTNMFYKCVQGKPAADAAYNDLVGQGKEASAVTKNSCSECQ